MLGGRGGGTRREGCSYIKASAPLPTWLFHLLAGTHARGTQNPNIEAPVEPKPLWKVTDKTASPGGSVVPDQTPMTTPLSFHPLFFPPPPSFCPCCCSQGERGRRHRNERFSGVPSPGASPNSFFMAPCSDKSHCFSLVSVRRAISQS